ncbi:MAG TPA: M48 family peptidase [Spirochaetales bacterium]|nr:M48 family peptidase [Spirochaetales bacterium]
MKNTYIQVDRLKYPLKVYYESRKNSTVSIGKKAVYIRIPNWLNKTKKLKILEELKGWAQKTLRNKPGYFLPHLREYYSGEILNAGNRRYILQINYKDKKSSSAKLFKGTIELSISTRLTEEKRAKHISTLISRCLSNERLPELKERILKLNNNLFRQRISNIFFKYNKSNWGSCSANGNINISTRLLFAPDQVLDYVCIHELAHLIEHNHSPEFWSLVKKAMPDYKKQQQWLKENQDKCWF